MRLLIKLKLKLHALATQRLFFQKRAKLDLSYLGPLKLAKAVRFKFNALSTV
jgi:hypothetical protein